MHIKLLYNLVALLSNRLADTGLLVESLQLIAGEEDEEEIEFDDDEEEEYDETDSEDDVPERADDDD